jgi:hypothetical protein
MNDSPTTLGQWSSPDMAITAREHVRRKADVAREALGRDGAEHVAALEALGDYIAGCGPQDPRLWTLSLIAGCYGDRDRFHAGKMADELLSRLGNWREGAAPHLEVTLSELIGAEVSDLIEHLAGAASEATKAREIAENESRELKDQAAAGEAAQGELLELRRRVEELEELNAELEQKADYLRAHYGTEKKEKRTRRTKVEGETGIYYNELATGRPFEIGWSENGKQRWETVGDDLEQARELRQARIEGKELTSV